MSVINRIKKQVSILQEVDKTTKYTGSGPKKKACCPFHDDRDPSMVINTTSGHFRCFGCGARGSVIDWVMERDGLNLYDAVDQITEEWGINREHDPQWEARREVIRKNKAKAEGARQNLETLTGPRAYLAKRGISEESVQHFGLGATPNGDGVVIPFADAQGSIVGFAVRKVDPNAKPKYLNSSAKEGFDKGANLYNLANARRALKDRLYVVEGYFDVWSAHQAGYPATVAICTSKLTEEQALLIGATCYEGEPIVLVPDTDKTGQDRCADNIAVLASKAPRSPVYVVNLPGKDLGDLTGNQEAVQVILERPMTATEWLVRKALRDEPDLDSQMRAVERIALGVTNPIERDGLAELLAEAWKKDLAIVRDFLGTARERGRIDPGKLLTVGSSILDYLTKSEGHHLGFSRLDVLTRGVSAGEVVGVMARSGVGKTTIALNIANNLIKRYRETPGVFFSMEQQAGPVELRLAQIHYGQERESVTDRLIFDGAGDLTGAFRNLLICQEGGLTVADMDEYISVASSRRFDAPVGWIVIDYLGYIAAPRGMTKTYEVVTYNAKAVKQLAKKHNLMVVLLIQTGRGEKGDGSEPVSFADARDSGAIEESVDFMLGAWRPSLADPANIPQHDTMMVRLLKNRNGPPGEASLNFDTHTLRITEGVIRNGPGY